MGGRHASSPGLVYDAVDESTDKRVIDRSLLVVPAAGVLTFIGSTTISPAVVVPNPLALWIFVAVLLAFSAVFAIRWPSITTRHVGKTIVAGWAGWSASLHLVGFGHGTIPFLLVWYLSVATLLVAAVAVVFFDWRRGLLLLASIVAVAGAVGALTNLQLAAREVQVRFAESGLTAEITAATALEVDGVFIWEWIPGLVDGGRGVAYNTRHPDGLERLNQAWSAVTADPAECRHLYDQWYWCGRDLNTPFFWL